MVQLQEITDGVAEKLKLAEAGFQAGAADKAKSGSGDASSPSPSPSTAPAPAPAPAPALTPVAGPELPPARAMASARTAEEVLADLNKSPLFMTDLEENDDIAALQALAYEGTPFENARDFKDRGNECFRESQWTDAREFYDKGVALLVGEDRRRARGEPPVKPERAEPEAELELGTNADREEPLDPDSPEGLRSHRALLEQLYVNRAACQLNLRNYRACTLDCGAALRLNAANSKAWYRSGRALLALDKTDEAAEACGGGLAADPASKALQKLAADVAARAEVVAARKRAEAEREARVVRKAARLQAALRARGIRTRATEQQPEMEDAAVALVQPDDDGAATTDVSHSSLVFPTMLLYPMAMETDFIKAFGEHETMADHLAYILPPPWEEEAMPGVGGGGLMYGSAAAVDCYMETVTGGLIKVGKKMALGTVLSRAQVEVVDGLVRMFVVPRGAAEEWTKEFKRKKAAERGEHRV